MGNDAADYDNDGQIDLITADMLPPDEKTLKTYGNGEHLDIYNQKIIKNGYQNQYSRNCLQRNNGNGISFSDVGLMSGVSATDWSWSPLFADFDNDGNKDLFISNGIVKRPLDLDFIMFMSNAENLKAINSKEKYEDLVEKMPGGELHPFVFKGDGNSNFKDVSESWGTGNLKGCFNGAAYADLNNDGNLDVVISSLNAKAIILKNNAPKKNYLSIAFKGDAMNTTGIGAKAYLFTGAKIQYQQLMLTRGFMSSTEARLHFGLDSLPEADSLLVVWPNQKYQLLRNVLANKQILVNQSNAVQSFNYELFFPKRKVLPEDITGRINIKWKHKENNFNDFNNQYLIPHMESSREPKLAVADVNKDGLDDFFVCGSKDQPGCMMIQTKEGKFVNSDTAVFNKNKVSEGVDAVFFDANNDSYPDLYVVSGGSEYEDRNPALADHLYLNDGKGNFKEKANALPSILTNKTCVAVADVNKDGKKDIFVGGFAEANKYGYAQPSYLLLNDGNGNFKRADESVISLKETGMVTSSAFADINNDGWPDLIAAGEWMPVKIFINNKGTFKTTEIPQSAGLWQTIDTSDVNGDRFTDILAGNWGQNSKLYAGKNGPLKLYVKDFSKNGSLQQVIAYTIDGKEYPFLATDQLQQALPQLKKAHETYTEVAGKTIQYMFGDMLKDSKELKAETLSSSCFINDGKGNFKRADLPQELQSAPLFVFTSFSYNNTITCMAAGNFYGVLPFEGRYDAMIPSFFSYSNKTKQFNMQSTLPSMDGEVRDAKWINGAGGKKILIIARYNRELAFLQYTKE